MTRASDYIPYPSPQEVALHIERQLLALLRRQLAANERPFPLEVHHAIDAGVAAAFRAFDERNNHEDERNSHEHAA
jgi:predicted amidohydrolase YtcJ